MRYFNLFLLSFLFFFLPFHPFLFTFFSQHIENEMFLFSLQAWKEIIISILILLNLFNFIKNFNKIDRADMLIFAFILISLITGILFTGEGFPENFTQLIWGFKYGLLFLLFFVFIRFFGLRKKDKDVILNIIISTGAVVIIFGFAQSLFLNEDFLKQFGYNQQYGVIDSNEKISYCHKIENSITNEEFCRVQSFLSGPNQLGAYLLFLIPIFFYRFLKVNDIFHKMSFFIILLMGIFVLLSTWSRSAFLGFIVMLALFFIIESRSFFAVFLYLITCFFGVIAIFYPAFFNIESWDAMKDISIKISLLFFSLSTIFFIFNLFQKYFLRFFSFLILSCLGLIIFIRYYYDTFFWNIILRGSSTQGHYERSLDGIKDIINYPFGLGLGDAGPASARFANEGEIGYLPESWYLQVGLESGFLGLLLFLMIIFLVGYMLLKTKKSDAKPIFLSLAGISTAALFLHSWESSIIALSFWGVAGIILRKNI